MSKHHAWPSWRYGPKGEAAVFESEADVPAGWHDHPSKHKNADSSPEKGKPGRKPKAGEPLDL